MSEMRCVKIIVEGKVQGVFFRKHTQEVAMENKLSGFVRNMIDGSVYIEACGLNDNIDKLIKWCHAGPEEAAVKQVQVVNIEPKTFQTFEIRGTEKYI